MVDTYSRTNQKSICTCLLNGMGYGLNVGHPAVYMNTEMVIFIRIVINFEDGWERYSQHTDTIERLLHDVAVYDGEGL